MRLPIRPRHAPMRVATGAFILHTGLEKWGGDEQTAEGVHGMAAAAFPFLKPIPPRRFLRMLACAEIATGTALLAPIVPSALAGAALTGFSSGLVTLYLRTPALRMPGSIWPNQEGIAISKDVWMLGIGLGLIADGVECRR